MRLPLLLLTTAGAWAQSVQWTQTARDGSLLTLLQDQPELHFHKLKDGELDSKDAPPRLVLDTSATHQTIAGFGGAFTQAAAQNYMSLSEDDRAELMHLYFGKPEDGGHGYTMGRVPINSCDFAPFSYNFDNKTDDKELKHFDDSVKQDVDNGMVPMIKAAQAKIKERDMELSLLASPWSPPGWMKLPGPEGVKSMVTSAKPNGLDPDYQRPWAKYMSRWIDAYKAHGIGVWGVTVQNEPEATAGWESMLYTPSFMASFVKEHLGPVLKADHPGIKIFGFDHNKDHVLEWAKGLYSDAEAAEYFDGVGVHWYGGLNTDKLEATHEFAPDKSILATEACNCVGNVVLQTASVSSWWNRAEKLALDILEDLKFWAIGWIDWNLVVSTQGGPNHLKNFCDANIIADPNMTLGQDSAIVKQASFYYMGHFSRYVPAGSVRVGLENLVETEVPPLSPADVKNGIAMSFHECDDSVVQLFDLVDGSVVLHGTNEAPGSDGFNAGGECVEFCISGECWFPKVQAWTCAAKGSSDPFHGSEKHNQKWTIKKVKGGVQLVNGMNNKCLTSVHAAGWAVGLDAGIKAVAAQVTDCAAPGSKNQTFVMSTGGSGDDASDASTMLEASSSQSKFTLKSLSDGLCMQPELEKLPHFDAVAFKLPDDSYSLVAMNLNDQDVPLRIHDTQAGTALDHTMPGHSIHTYRWTPAKSDHKSTEAEPTTAPLLTMASPVAVPLKAQESHQTVSATKPNAETNAATNSANDAATNAAINVKSAADSADAMAPLSPLSVLFMFSCMVVLAALAAARADNARLPSKAADWARGAAVRARRTLTGADKEETAYTAFVEHTTVEVQPAH